MHVNDLSILFKKFQGQEYLMLNQEIEQLRTHALKVSLVLFNGVVN